MPFFAIAHNYAFSYHDFIDANHSFVARMPMYYAFRDAFGAKDVIEDSKATLRGKGMDYREFEPAEGLMHQGVGLENRIRAGLRYSRGGRKKYWLPKTAGQDRRPGRAERTVNKAVRGIASNSEGVHAPLLENQAEDVVHLAPDMIDNGEDTIWDAEREDGEEGYDLPFGDVDEMDEELFDHSKKYLFGDYNYPTIDVSSESARVTIWAEEERVLRDERGAWFSPIRGSKGVEAMRQREGFAWQGYGAVSNPPTKPTPSTQDGKRPAAFYGEQRVIDHEQERMTVAAAGDSKDVVMKWTRIQRNDNGGGSISRTSSHTKPNPRTGAGSSSAGSSSPHVRSSPIVSRTNSRSGVVSNAFSPDAVDLVVEESQAEGMEPHERRKGEPSIRGPVLKKVYRKEFSMRGKGGGDLEVIEPRRDVTMAIDSETISEVVEERTRDGNKVDHSEWPTNTAQEDDPTTFLQSGHVQTYRYDDIPDDHNPWA